MKKGRTFITNGPALDLKVNGAPIGSTIPLDGGGKLEVEVTFASHYPVVAVEIVADGAVVHRQGFGIDGSRDGTVRCELFAERDGWLAARVWGDARDSFNQSIYAHTSPTWFHCGRPPASRHDAARFFLEAIDASLSWVGRYNNDRQRNEVKELFRRGREAYAEMAKP